MRVSRASICTRITASRTRSAAQYPDKLWELEQLFESEARRISSETLPMGKSAIVDYREGCGTMRR
jgi:hypothetical protein